MCKPASDAEECVEGMIIWCSSYLPVGLQKNKLRGGKIEGQKSRKNKYISVPLNPHQPTYVPSSEFAGPPTLAPCPPVRAACLVPAAWKVFMFVKIDPKEYENGSEMGPYDSLLAHHDRTKPYEWGSFSNPSWPPKALFNSKHPKEFPGAASGGNLLFNDTLPQKTYTEWKCIPPKLLASINLKHMWGLQCYYLWKIRQQNMKMCRIFIFAFTRPFGSPGCHSPLLVQYR